MDIFLWGNLKQIKINVSVILFTMNVKYCFFSSIDQLEIPNFFLPNIYLQWYQKKEKGKTKKNVYIYTLT